MKVPNFLPIMLILVGYDYTNSATASEIDLFFVENWVPPNETDVKEWIVDSIYDINIYNIDGSSIESGTGMIFAVISNCVDDENCTKEIRGVSKTFNSIDYKFYLFVHSFYSLEDTTEYNLNFFYSDVDGRGGYRVYDTYVNNTNEQTKTPFYKHEPGITVYTIELVKREVRCGAGLENMYGSDCTECKVGTYKNTPSTDTCTRCDLAIYSNNTGLQECSRGFCDYGYGGPDCDECAAGKYKNDTSTSECTSCPGTSTSGTGSVGGDSCVCDAGYTGGDCTACESGKYKTSPGSDDCTSCPGTSTSGTGSVGRDSCV
jgi:hypothetical protein